MKLRAIVCVKTILCVILMALIAPASISAQTINYATDFTYQGDVELSGMPVTGTCNFEFALFNALGGGTQIGATQTVSGVPVVNGVFNVVLDFGELAFNGVDTWLQIAVTCDANPLTLLTPRQPITPAPYALGLYGFYTQPNTTSPNIVGGFVGNIMGAGIVGGTISGGGASGNANQVTANYGTVGGGQDNTASNIFAVISGGIDNLASGYVAVVGGGQDNTASSNYAVVSGGVANRAGGAAVVGGGYNNAANGSYATIPGGISNTALGDYSFAAGYIATANDDFSFVWSGRSTGTPSSTTSWGESTFTARAPGGVRFYSSASGITDGVELPAGGNAWSILSDRDSKSNFESVDTRAVLESLVNIPITTWNYNSQDESIRHMGPVAQDFYAAFGVGEDDRHISTIDPDGVALAAIQGLYAEMQERDSVFVILGAIAFIIIGALIVIVLRQNHRIARFSHVQQG